MRHSKSLKKSQRDMNEICKPAPWPGESSENGETPYMQRRQRAATAAGMILCECGGLIWPCGKCGDCGRPKVV